MELKLTVFFLSFARLLPSFTKLLRLGRTWSCCILYSGCNMLLFRLVSSWPFSKTSSDWGFCAAFLLATSPSSAMLTNWTKPTNCQLGWGAWHHDRCPFYFGLIVLPRLTTLDNSEININISYDMRWHGNFYPLLKYSSVVCLHFFRGGQVDPRNRMDSSNFTPWNAGSMAFCMAE